jgi:hypothetical protein
VIKWLNFVVVVVEGEKFNAVFIGFSPKHDLQGLQGMATIFIYSEAFNYNHAWNLQWKINFS